MQGTNEMLAVVGEQHGQKAIEAVRSVRLIHARALAAAWAALAKSLRSPARKATQPSRMMRASQPRLERWFREQFSPRFGPNDPHPSEAVQWAGAKREVSPHVKRKQIRECRNKYRPEWKVRGRPLKTRRHKSRVRGRRFFGPSVPAHQREPSGPTGGQDDPTYCKCRAADGGGRKVPRALWEHSLEDAGPWRRSHLHPARSPVGRLHDRRPQHLARWSPSPLDLR
jgi:hypothetical protein